MKVWINPLSKMKIHIASMPLARASARLRGAPMW